MDILSNAEQRMSKAISNFQDAIAVLRTGRANAALLENIECDYYGDRMNITSIAAIKVPEPRQLLIVPYDQGDIKAIVAAINASDIGINPVVDGKQIRLVIPPLTEDRRKELVKKAKTNIILLNFFSIDCGALQISYAESNEHTKTNPIKT